MAKEPMSQVQAKKNTASGKMEKKSDGLVGENKTDEV
jgi:hypothetical protein